jgi:hypothetical protein
MKDLIKRILRESRRISSDAPDWVHDFDGLPRNDRIAQIKKNKEYIEKLTPSIVNFFEKKYGNDLDRIEIKKKDIHYGNDNYSAESVLLEFYFNKVDINKSNLIKVVENDIKNFFNIDVKYYGVPLDLKFYLKSWNEILY